VQVFVQTGTLTLDPAYALRRGNANGTALHR